MSHIHVSLRLMAIGALAASLFLVSTGTVVHGDEQPATPSNGLLAEIKIPNSFLYPGDDLEIDFRLTNARDKGEMQIIDLITPGFTCQWILTDPDGKKTVQPCPKAEIKPPDYPTATLQPGAFLGRKIILDSAVIQKPGRYSIAVRYFNDIPLKENGFDCWTGKATTNTAVFEVASVEAPVKDGVQMLIKMKKQTYVEKEPVEFTVSMKNVSDGEKKAYVSDEYLIHEWAYGRVTDASGKEVQWRKSRYYAVPFPQPMPLAAGESFDYTDDLGCICALPTGKYKFTLRAKIHGMGEWISNEVSFEVTPRSPDAPVQNGVQMLVKMRREKYVEREPVEFTVSMRNVSKENKTVDVPGVYFFHECAYGRVTDAAGRAVPWQSRVCFEVAPEPEFEGLAPGKTCDREHDLLDVCYFPAGQYKFVLMVRNKPNDWTSNEVSFEITPAKRPKPVKGSDGVKDGSLHTTLTTSREKYAEGEPVKFTVSYRNDDNIARIFNMSYMTIAYMAEVRNAAGEQVRLRLLYDGSLKYKKVNLPPGKTYSEEFDLLRMCELPPGKYSLLMRGWHPSTPPLKVAFEVVPAEKPEKSEE